MNVPFSYAAKRESMRIAGKHITTDDAIEVRNPYDGSLVGTVPAARPEHVREAFAKAKAFKSKLSRFERQQILQKAAELLRGRRATFARIISAESGLCWKDALYEATRAYDVWSFAAQLAVKDDGESYACDISPNGKARRIHTLRTPLLGVISAITPFNHPLNQVAHKVAPSVATNNRMVLKPTEKTPLSALVLADILYEAGLPPPMYQVVTGDPREIADEMLTNPDVDLVTFTGGVAVGKVIAAKAVYKRQVLELGGNDPIIVMDDADLEEAASLAAAGSYKNSGQRCTAVKRILVHDKVADAFVEKLVAKTRAWTYGDPMDDTLEMGTVIDEAAAKNFEARVNDAVARGAKLLAGNERRGAVYSPTVIDHVDPEMNVVKTETFGPVSPVIRFRDLDHAIAISNGTAYGLSSSVCTNRLDVITRLVRELHVGTVNVREVPGYRLELTPFGGIKDSGLGHKEGVQEAMKSFTNVKTYSLPW